MCIISKEGAQYTISAVIHVTKNSYVIKVKLQIPEQAIGFTMYVLHATCIDMLKV